MEFCQNFWANLISTNMVSAGNYHQEILNSAIGILKQPFLKDAQIVTALDYIHIVGNISCGKVADPARNMGLAVEFPFLWPEIVNFGFSLPLDFKRIDNRVKFPLKKLLDNYMSREYTDRKKAGFTPPLAKWLMDKEFNYHIKQLLSKRIYLRDYLLGIELEKMLEIALSKKKEFRSSIYNIVWLTLFTELWFANAAEIKYSM
jgi:asparagine synthetase B (glutamine-hydrolysing)